MGGQDRCGRSRVKGQASVNGVERVKVEVGVGVKVDVKVSSKARHVANVKLVCVAAPLTAKATKLSLMQSLLVFSYR